MEGKKIILNYCPNYDEIINCDFLEDDVLTKKLIEYYQDYIFSFNINNENEENDTINLIAKLDHAIHKYIEDYRFAKNLKETLDVEMVTRDDFVYLDQLMKYIIDFFHEYEKIEVRDIIQTKWI